MLGSRPQTPPMPENEAERLDYLNALEVMDTPNEERFDRITRMASQVFRAPMAFISLVDGERQWFKSAMGLEISESPREIAFCAHAICEKEPLLVENTLEDERFAENPFVTEPPNLRFYAGAPLKTRSGIALGTLAVADILPRKMSAHNLNALADLALVVVDQLELRQIAKRARAAETRLTDAVEALPDGFVLFDDEDRVVLCNQRYREIYAESASVIKPGERFEDILRHGLGKRQYAEAIGRENEWLAERLAAHQAPGAPVVQNLPGDRWVRVQERRTSEGGCVGFRVDITELERNRRALAETSEMLERRVEERTATIESQKRELTLALEQARRVNEQQREFAAMASHEFRTPLAIIDGAMRRIARRIGDDESGAKLIDTIHKSIARMTGMIESTLSMTQIAAGVLTLEPKECDLKSVLENCVHQQQSLRPSHQLALNMRHVPSSAILDPNALAQVLENLISNAVKFSPQADRVEIDAVADAEALEVSVRDFGHGIDPLEIDRIFDRFYRSPTVSEISGVGIGLDISRELLQAHGGEINVRSTLNEGSTFTMRVPLSPAQEQPKANA